MKLFLPQLVCGIGPSVPIEEQQPSFALSSGQMPEEPYFKLGCVFSSWCRSSTLRTIAVRPAVPV
jgi:hypothetical protein